jgi:uncharacterized phiE125 gp8 family phage protein
MFAPGFACNVTSEPAAEPISTADAKTHLRVTGSGDDTYIDTLVKMARRHVERVCGLSLITQTRALRLDAFPCEDAIELPYGPLQSVSSVAYLDSDGTSQTWSSSNYRADIYSLPPRVALAYGVTWPTTRGVSHSVTVTYIAGYGAAGSSVPADIIHAMKLIVGHLYETREQTSAGFELKEIPMGAAALLAPYRIHSW